MNRLASKEGKQPDFTPQQRLFIAEYVRCLNATKAAIAAGYSEKSARQTGSDNLAVPKIREAINARLTERKASSEDVIARIQQHATANMGDFISQKEQEVTVGRGKTKMTRTVKYWDLDLEKADKLGLLQLVREFKVDPKTGAVTVKLYDAQKALGMLGRHYHALGNERPNEDDEDDTDDITDEDIAEELGKL